VVDAGIALKWLIREPLHEAALGLLDGRVSLHAPSLILVEIEQALWKKIRRGEINPQHARAVRQRIAAYFDFIHPLEDISGRGLEIALRWGYPIYDCFYLACVEALDLPLVTADERLLATVQTSCFAARVVSLARLAAPRS
jgi:predicted nucleic acid-binding protein